MFHFGAPVGLGEREERPVVPRLDRGAVAREDTCAEDLIAKYDIAKTLNWVKEKERGGGLPPTVKLGLPESVDPLRHSLFRELVQRTEIASVRIDPARLDAFARRSG